MSQPLKNMDVDTGGILSHNDSYDYNDYESPPDEESAGSGASMLFIPVLYTVVAVVGLLGNALLLCLLTQRRRFWRVSDIFILHLAIADVLLLVTLPFWAAQAAHPSGWMFEVTLCKISGAMFHINFYCGIFLLVCISLDRCLSIVYTTQLFFFKTPMSSQICCLLVWLASMLLAIPDWIFLTTRKEQHKTLCDRSYTQLDSLLSNLVHLTLGLVLPAATLIICSCMLLQPRHGSKILQGQRAIVITLPVIVFFLFWLPYNITVALDTIRNNSKEHHGGHTGSLKTALAVTSALGCVHACLRPLLYFGLCPNFRKGTLAVLKRSAVQSKNSLWELGVGEKAQPHQRDEHEEQMKQMTVQDQVQSTQC